MQEIQISQLTENFIETIGKEWMLITAGSLDEGFNTMTASWGGIGFLWNRPIVYTFVRPERYTYEFMEKQRHFTLSFLGEEQRDIYKLCGSQSGREINKVKACNLHPEATPHGSVIFSEARLSIACETLYSEMLNPEAFLRPELLSTWYGAKGGMHKMYIGEILSAWQGE